MFISENELHNWIQGHEREGQGVTAELIFRLVAVSCPNPKERRFPREDSIGQTGEDGYLNTECAFDPFVPRGKSYWEFGSGARPRDKATKDYGNRTQAVEAAERAGSAFIFVTPLSAVHSWGLDSQKRWLQDRLTLGEWRDVRVLDGTCIVDWLQQFPAVERWLARRMGKPIQHLDTPELRWRDLRSIGAPPPLVPRVFLANRDKARAKLAEVYQGDLIRLRIDARYPSDIADFVSAYLATIPADPQLEVNGRWVIVNSADAFQAITELHDRHVIVADLDLYDDDDSTSARLLEKAKRAGHAVIFAGEVGGIFDENRVFLPNPKENQVTEALVEAGYSETRASLLARKTSGKLTTLLLMLQDLSVAPEWSQNAAASELAIAVLLGSWREGAEADRSVVEKLSGKEFGAWIGIMREVALCPGTPLIQRDGRWRFSARYEGWYELGPKIFDDLLDRLEEVSVAVLRERDPQFELPPSERHAAAVHDKVLRHSASLRSGLAQCLALLGSQAKALTSCSIGKAEATARLSVREILGHADWVNWASLDRLLPLIAEAAPVEFLDAVDDALEMSPSPFESVFSQESGGFFGSTYMSGLLWALETLAWDEEYLTRVVVALGGLAAIDPGGSYSNRPASSLSTILLPWHPQTCAPVRRRLIAVETLLKEFPKVGWALLLNLLPSPHQVTMGTRKPEWREIIPDGFSTEITYKEHWEQISGYTALAITAAKKDLSKLVGLVERLSDIPLPACDQLLDYLGSDEIVSKPEVQRLQLWNELAEFVSKHRKYSNAAWAMKPRMLERVVVVADILSPKEPFLRHQRLFTERDFDLYEEKGDYEYQQKELDSRRRKALSEIYSLGGVTTILEFAKSVESPWRAGFVLGEIAAKGDVMEVLPSLLETEDNRVSQFAGGFVRGRFHELKWSWIDALNTSSWTSSQKGQLLAYLPFVKEVWERSESLLGDDETQYWSRANANAYESEEGLEVAADRLAKYGRAFAAARCLEVLIIRKGKLDSNLAVRILDIALHSSEDCSNLPQRSISIVINALQNDPFTNSDDLFKLEWSYLPLLGRFGEAKARLLEKKLSEDPRFFCEVIGFAFRSTKQKENPKEVSEQQRNLARHAHHLLTEWRRIPGTRDDGTLDSEALAAWLEEVKRSSTATGHLEIALQRIGHVLRYAPPDPEGLSIHHSVARALNAKDSDHMRIGFTTELFNTRGTHTFTAGQEEREIAAKYREQADQVESHGYHRLADSLKKLAASYEQNAEREALRDPFED